jgi:predicted AlkP superfamily pyrophosphatase or phosphodiesterase
MGSVRRPLVVALLPVLLSGCRATEEAAAGESPVDGPALVVLIAVDQLRTDMLDRYEALFTGGLRRLLDQGYRFPNGTHDHAFTFTAPGHTSLGTGVHPTRHGIVGNEWWELRSGAWQEVYSMADPAAPILGYPAMAGRSPANLYRGGLADWISGSSTDARVVSISRKDRAAIGLAAQAAGEVYWMADPVAGFITSSHYRSEYPEWVVRFNQEVMPGIYADTVWESRVPEEAKHLSRPDTSDYERGGRRAVFPYRPPRALGQTNPAAVTVWRSGTPAPDAAVLGLARAAIEELELGQRSVVDYLAVSFSQTDRIGHRYGPFSREQLDNLLHLDAVLGDLFEMLDDAVGSEGWVAGFSSDHGILEIPEYLADMGVDARRLGREEITEFRRAVAGVVNGGAQGEALAWGVKSALEELPFVEAAYTFSEVEDAQSPPDSFAVLFARSLSRERAVTLPARYGVYHRWRPNYIASGDEATHGSPYYYDRSVPIIFLGAGVDAGVSQEAAATVDVAPTLARLAGIEAPDDLDGRVLLEPPVR